MSQENVEALRWLCGEWGKGDLWALRKIADPKIEWERTPGMESIAGEQRIYRGLDALEAVELSEQDARGNMSHLQRGGSRSPR